MPDTDAALPRRRQNVACATCKLRRVKCDLSALLQSHTSSPSDPGPSFGTSASAPEPSLADLIRRNPEIHCTNCTDRDIICNKDGILNPSRTKQKGKRITEAKRRYGVNEQGGTAIAAPTCSASSGTSRTSHSPVAPEPDFSPFDGSRPDPYLAQATREDLELPSLDYDFSPSTLPSSFMPKPLCPPPRPPPTQVEFSGQYFNAITVPRNSEAASIWWQFANQPQETMAHITRTGKTPQASPAVESATSLWDSTTLGGQVMDHVGSFASAPSLTPLEAIALDRSAFERSREASSVNLDPFVTTSLQRKRSREPSSSPTTSRKTLAQAHDPWQLWMGDDESRAMLLWGRAEDMQERLANRALGTELSRHLVTTFFQAVHFSFPAISPESFYLEWMRAGQRSDRMTPAQEVLCSGMEAWGARYSDNPMILGLQPHMAGLAPRVIMSDGTLKPTGIERRSQWGRARMPACRALIERTRRLVDSTGLMRKPSVTGVQALTLFVQLLFTSDESIGEARLLEANTIQSTILEQMRLLGLMWGSEQPIAHDRAELPMTLTQMRMKQRRLFWTHAIVDAFWSASSRSAPKILDEDLESAGKWVRTLRSALPPSSFEALAFFLECNFRIAKVVRGVALNMAIPSKKKGAIDVEQFCRDARNAWKEADSITDELNRHTSHTLNSCSKDEILGFSPLNFFLNLRLSVISLLFIAHDLIREQLEFRKTLSSAYIVASEDTESVMGGDVPEIRRIWKAAQSHLEMMQALDRESVDMLLSACRGQVHMFKTAMHTGIMQTATLILRVLIFTTKFLCGVPTNEQGYPTSTRGGRDWTWARKQEEVGHCVEALYQIGWAWGDVGPVLDDIERTMERHSRTHEELSMFQGILQTAPKETPEAEGARERRQERKESDEKAIEAVMRFWPAISVPQLIEEALRPSHHRSPSSQSSSSFQAGPIELNSAQFSAVMSSHGSLSAAFSHGNLEVPSATPPLQHLNPAAVRTTATPASESSSRQTISDNGFPSQPDFDEFLKFLSATEDGTGDVWQGAQKPHTPIVGDPNGMFAAMMLQYAEGSDSNKNLGGAGQIPAKLSLEGASDDVSVESILNELEMGGLQQMGASDNWEASFTANFFETETKGKGAGQ
ncbi:hypothetical protein L202_04980 [Cryptococcus amylolentus CBS 6039]|uniref:Zn(2)-C6 fungal-type domain-containing protein n=1 Tax=Cryptococcus amylolentus CBS 6039 TaxID=1295533 RepID=A0A1E3HQ76_9TREE|nr:hypothetical protein L202_04980 [Cryptococcus amylolentus CBS 6039]ODN77866.1 hypothetical protein L202_04980 [Cryptococcus amylolentus CBS 6039]